MKFLLRSCNTGEGEVEPPLKLSYVQLTASPRFTFLTVFYNVKFLMNI